MNRKCHCLPGGHTPEGVQKGHFRQRNDMGENILVRVSTEVEITHMSYNWRMDIQNVVYPYNQTLLTCRKE